MKNTKTTKTKNFKLSPTKEKLLRDVENLPTETLQKLVDIFYK